MIEADPSSSLTEGTIIPYSKAWNRKFAEQIQATFPLEIRSMIHDYLLDSVMWDEYEYALQAVTSAVPPDVGHCRCLIHGNGQLRVPHYLFAKYMGSETAQEIVGKLYRSNWFKEQTLYGIAPSLHNLIHKDAFGAGFDPASCIKSLDVVCLVDEHRQPPTSHARNETCQHTPYERKYIHGDQLKSDFDHLLEVVHNPNFQCLEVTFIQRNIRIDVLEEALETFANVHQAFKTAGISMRIQWMYTSPTCDGMHEHSRNLGKFFSDPRSTWKRRMFEFLEKVSNPLQRKDITDSPQDAALH